MTREVGINKESAKNLMTGHRTSLRESLHELAMLFLPILFFGTITGTVLTNEFVNLHQQKAYGQLDFIQPGVQQEICFNGFDDDGNGFVDDSCPTGLDPTAPQAQLPAQSFDQFVNATTAPAQLQLSPETFQGLTQQPIDQFGNVVAQDNSTQQQLQSIQQQLSAMQQQLQSIQQLLLEHTQEQQPSLASPANQSIPTNQTSQPTISASQNLQQCINNAVSQGMTNLQIRQQCGTTR